MKYSVILVLFISLFASCLTPYKAPKVTATKRDYPKPFEFIMVDTVALGKNEIYVRAVEWISKSYGSAKSVIDMQDKEAGKIIGKSYIQAPYVGGDVRYVMTIDVKDGRYRAEISGFWHSGGRVPGPYNAPIDRNYGNLEQDKYEYKSQSTGNMVEDRKYYAVKNEVMDMSTLLLLSLKAKMREEEKKY